MHNWQMRRFFTGQSERPSVFGLTLVRAKIIIQSMVTLVRSFSSLPHGGKSITVATRDEPDRECGFIGDIGGEKKVTVGKSIAIQFRWPIVVMSCLLLLLLRWKHVQVLRLNQTQYLESEFPS